MATGKKTGGRDFEKGVYKGGPGRTPLPEEVRKLKNFHRADVERVFHNAMGMEVSELKEKLKDPKLKTLDGMVYRICLNGIEKGEPVYLGFMLDRTIGKPKEIPTEIIHTIRELPTHEVIELAKDAIKILSKEGDNYAAEKRLIESYDQKEHQD